MLEYLLYGYLWCAIFCAVGYPALMYPTKPALDSYALVVLAGPVSIFVFLVWITWVALIKDED